MTTRTEREDRLAVAIAVVAAVLGVSALVLSALVRRHVEANDAIPNAVSALSGIVYAALGALIVRRARNVIGWILVGVGLGLTVLSLSGAYSVAGIAWRPGSLPGPVLAGAIGEWVFGPSITALAFLLFLFPTGTLPSPRWRPVLMTGLVAAGVTTIGFIVNPVTYAIPAPGRQLVPHRESGRDRVARRHRAASCSCRSSRPWRWRGASFGSLVVRYRSAGRDERQQIKWVAFVAALALVAQAVAFASLIACGCDNSPVANVAFVVTEVARSSAFRPRSRSRS